MDDNDDLLNEQKRFCRLGFSLTTGAHGGRGTSLQRLDTCVELVVLLPESVNLVDLRGECG